MLYLLVSLILEAIYPRKEGLIPFIATRALVGMIGIAARMARFAGVHLLRDPLDYLETVGLTIERCAVPDGVSSWTSLLARVGDVGCSRYELLPATAMPDRDWRSAPRPGLRAARLPAAD